MTQRNALMELIEQGRRLSKHFDMMVLNKIDYVFRYLWILDVKKIREYKDIIQPIITYYHKPDLFEIIKNKKNLDGFIRRTNHDKDIQSLVSDIVERNSDTCIAREDYGQCTLCTHLSNAITDIFEGCLNRYKKDKEALDLLLCEIVDFMHERPELVNINLIDDYVRMLIDEVCTRKNKINPLATDLVDRFGKFWRDDQGNWHEEKRKRR